jgi:hypothetical protein
MCYRHSYAFSPLLLTNIINRTVDRKLFMMCSLFAGLKVAARQTSPKAIKIPDALCMRVVKYSTLQKWVYCLLLTSL